MVFVHDFKNWIIQQVVNKMSVVKLGSGTTPEQESDTNLESEISGSEATPTVQVFDKSYSWSAVYPSGTLTGSTISEIADFESDGTIISRSTFYPFIKQDSDETTFVMVGRIE